MVAWLEGHSQLPPYAALITFDDGYRDNFDNAFPVLRARNLPATIFLATDCIGSSKPFYWDLAAHCFKNTKLHVAELPVLGTSRWLNDDERQDVALRWVSTVKSLPDSEKQQAAARLPETLDVTLSDRSFADLHLTWEQVCKMQAVGFEMGAHTCSHPILARIPLSEARRQISESRTAIEENTQQPVVTFAYPNGLSSDFTQAHQTLLAEFGFRAGFTLVPGPMSFSRALQQPMAIRRIFIGWRDDLPRFLAKLTGLARLADRLFAGK
ncbi:MAG: polysaccharide deacetylase family protein [Gammaproteobacteria bacterium]|nr:polysaccharide deacetylase family protein [Gammaproteobacteria bacterium]